MLTAMAAVALLFVVFALVRPRAGCGGDCGICGKACSDSEHDHDE
jgi:hypothetical protein